MHIIPTFTRRSLTRQLVSFDYTARMSLNLVVIQAFDHKTTQHPDKDVGSFCDGTLLWRDHTPYD
jgi:hypothetical protein